MINVEGEKFSSPLAKSWFVLQEKGDLQISYETKPFIILLKKN